MSTIDVIARRRYARATRRAASISVRVALAVAKRHRVHVESFARCAQREQRRRVEAAAEQHDGVRACVLCHGRGGTRRKITPWASSAHLRPFCLEAQGGAMLLDRHGRRLDLVDSQSLDELAQQRRSLEQLSRRGRSSARTPRSAPASTALTCSAAAAWPSAVRAIDPDALAAPITAAAFASAASVTPTAATRVVPGRGEIVESAPSMSRDTRSISPTRAALASIACALVVTRDVTMPVICTMSSAAPATARRACALRRRRRRSRGRRRRRAPLRSPR